ncbi:major capsid protein [Enterococcus phage VEsP-2]|nr:major capsid protein [Enterococcus phage VEsP-2]
MTREEMLAKAQELLDKGEIEEARSMIASIKELDVETRAVANGDDKEETPKSDDEPKGEPKNEDKEPQNEDKPKEEEPKEDKPADDKEEPKDTEDKPKEEAPKDKEERSLLKDKGDKDNMEEVVLNGKETAGKEVTEVRSFLNYLRSKEVGRLPEQRALPADLAGMKSEDGKAVIPEEIITKARMLPETVVDLRNKVTRQKVTHAVGKYPILQANKAVLASTEELLKNPDLENPKFTEVQYEIETYRGQLAVAQEALDDSDDDLAGIIARHIQRQGLNTANKAIATELKTAEAVTATGIDEIKTAINTGFDPAYNLEFLVSQSFYNEVDLLKDAEGRYLLQPSLSAKSGKMLLGLDVTVLADELIGTNKGDKVAFLGQPDAFVTFFDRVDTTVRWVENMYYGQVLSVAMRFDCKVVDPAAGKYITLNVAKP